MKENCNNNGNHGNNNTNNKIRCVQDGNNLHVQYFLPILIPFNQNFAKALPSTR